MKKKIALIIIVLLVIFIGYKGIIMHKYHTDKVDIDTSKIFNETLTIKESEYEGEYISIDNLSIANYFDEYEDINGTFKGIYNDEGKVISFYSTGSTNQYIEMLDMKNFEIDIDGTTNYVTTSNRVKKYLDSHKIKNDIDLLRYIKDNYYFKSTIFTRSKNIEVNQILNTFVSVTLPSFKSITLIDGDIKGYIYNISTDVDVPIREVHIIIENKQYIVLLAGTEITSNDFIEELLSTVKYN